jgi:hypothetical protein
VLRFVVLAHFREAADGQRERQRRHALAVALVGFFKPQQIRRGKVRKRRLVGRRRDFLGR